jgi:endosialidase-like protein
MLRKLAFILAVAAGATLPFASPAPAAVADGALAGRTSLIDNSLIDKVQYEYGGHNYCYSDTGWKGPGWYWCGNEQTYGVGWGGAYGWRGWTYAGRGVGVGRYGGARVAHYGAVGGRYGGARVGHYGAAGGRYGAAGGRYGGGARGGFGGGGGARVGHHGGGRGGGGGARRGGGRRSDIRLKYDVVLLGRLDDGLGYYRFTYIGGHTQYVGVMAQDVQNVMPAAVTRDTDGYLRVSYDKLGLPFETYDQWLATGARLPVPNMVAH